MLTSMCCIVCAPRLAGTRQLTHCAKAMASGQALFGEAIFDSTQLDAMSSTCQEDWKDAMLWW